MKILIIDGNNLACVSYFSLRDEATADSVLYDFNRRINFYSNLINSEKVYVCWDSRTGSSWRKQLYPDYKAKRTEKDDLLISCIETCKTNKFTNLCIEDSEGDDTIYALCKVLIESGTVFDSIEIVSSDKDLIQCVQEKIAGGIINPIAGETDIYRKIPEYDIVEYKSIVGDNSDGIHGIPKKGEKFFEKYLKHEVTLLPEDMQVKNLCEKITRLSLNPSLQNNIDKVRSIL